MDKKLVKEYIELEHERWDLLDQLEELKKGVIRPKPISKPYKKPYFFDVNNGNKIDAFSVALFTRGHIKYIDPFVG